MGASPVPLAVMVGGPYEPSARIRQSPGMAADSAPPSAPSPATGTIRLQGGRSIATGPASRTPPVPAAPSRPPPVPAIPPSGTAPPPTPPVAPAPPVPPLPPAPPLPEV